MLILVLLLASNASFSSFGAPICVPQRNQITALREVAQVDDADRKSADAFGAANGTVGTTIERRYAATGDMVCPNGVMAQAQVVGTNDTVVTSAHVFNRKMDCKSIIAFKSCRFFTRVDGVEKSYKFKAVFGTGHKCPLPKGLAKTPPKDDWIVLKLEESTDSKIKPYRLLAAGENPLATGQKVVNVAKSIDWPPNAKGTLHERPRHYGDCQVNGVKSYDSGALALTNCDMSDGSSGGSLLTPGDNPALVGIVRGAVNPSLSVLCLGRDYSADKGDYDSDCWAGSHTIVTGEMRKAITDATAAAASGPASNTSAPGEGFKLPGMHL